MGVAGPENHQRRRVDLEDLRRISERTRMLAGSRKDNSDDFYRRRVLSNYSSSDTDEESGDELVCVTSGVSLLGLALVNQLLLRGFSVRILVDSPEDREKVREMKLKSEADGGVSKIWTLWGDLRESHSLANAFEGCRGVFHTSSFIDPSGLTGYSEAMVEVEKKVSESVMEACARTSSVRYCVFTSSLLACIWRDGTRAELPPVVDHDCWSDPSLCKDKKLWYALGKLKAEKAAWRIAKERDIKLVTICSALLTPPPDLSTSNSTPTIAYLKGAQEMYEQGLLATVSVRTLAEAHVNVYEAMEENEAYGRYICFDQIIKTQAEAEALAREICVPITKICQSQEEEEEKASTSTSSKFQLSNKRLFNLTSSRAPSTRCFSLNAFP